MLTKLYHHRGNSVSSTLSPASTMVWGGGCRAETSRPSDDLGFCSLPPPHGRRKGYETPGLAVDLGQVNDVMRWFAGLWAAVRLLRPAWPQDLLAGTETLPAGPSLQVSSILGGAESVPGED